MVGIVRGKSFGWGMNKPFIRVTLYILYVYRKGSVCDWFVVTTALFPIIDSISPFLLTGRVKKDSRSPKIRRCNLHSRAAPRSTPIKSKLTFDATIFKLKHSEVAEKCLRKRFHKISSISKRNSSGLSTR